jgi:death-on-curing protein
MIDVKTANYFHDVLIDKFGGSKGIRDLGALEAALNRPYATFDALDLYPDAIDKAAALFESIIINHPFIDGNKRIAYVLMQFILIENGVSIKTSMREKYKMVIDASNGVLRFDDIKLWLQSKTQINH